MWRHLCIRKHLMGQRFFERGWKHVQKIERVRSHRSDRWTRSRICGLWKTCEKKQCFFQRLFNISKCTNKLWQKNAKTTRGGKSITIMIQHVFVRGKQWKARFATDFRIRPLVGEQAYNAHQLNQLKPTQPHSILSNTYQETGHTRADGLQIYFWLLPRHVCWRLPSHRLNFLYVS